MAEIVPSSGPSSKDVSAPAGAPKFARSISGKLLAGAAHVLGRPLSIKSIARNFSLNRRRNSLRRQQSRNAAQVKTRPLGAVEQNWVQALSGGTGISVVLILLNSHVDPWQVEYAARELQKGHPSLRSYIVISKGGKSHLETPATSNATVILSERLSEDSSEPVGLADWEQILEKELNSPIAGVPHAELANHGITAQESSTYLPVLALAVHPLPNGRTAIAVRTHTSACDYAAVANIGSELVGLLDQVVEQTPKSAADNHPSEQQSRANLGWPVPADVGALQVERAGPEQTEVLPCIDDLVPKEKTKKSLFQRGRALVGYSVGSLGKPMLRFQPGWKMPLRTEAVHGSLTQKGTEQLLQSCAAQQTTLYGALVAACLKAVAASKQTGAHQETYGVTTMVNCRSQLTRPLTAADCGFFHLALMQHHPVAETIELWPLARGCSEALGRATADNEQFRDMWVLNTLFAQAMKHPHLTPHSSLRTSVLACFDSTATVSLPPLRALQTERFVGCASVHGVGPCLGLFSVIFDGCLQYTLTFPTPLFSREQVGQVRESMHAVLKDGPVSSGNGDVVPA